MYVASSKLGYSGCLLSTCSSYRKWVYQFAATQQQQHKSLKSSWVVGVPRRFSSLESSRATLCSEPTQLFPRRWSVVALSDDKGNGSVDTNGYQLPPEEIREIVDAPSTPALSFSPKRDEILFLQRRSLPPVADFAKPELKLAGMRIDPDYNARSRMSFYTGINIHKFLDEGMLGPGRSVSGLPEGAKINFVSWSPDAQHIAFSVRVPEEEDGPPSLLSLWVADVKTGQARKLIGPPQVCLNTIFRLYSWVDDKTIVVSTIPASHGSPPKKPLSPACPNIQSNEQKLVVQNRTYQDLLKDKHDEDLFDFYTTTQLVLVTLDGTVRHIGSPAIYTSVDASPDCNFLLVDSLHRPYSFNVPWGRFPKKIEVWRRNGEFVKEICDLPLAENISIASNSTRKGRRGVNWRPDKPASLYWVEAQDGGDPKVDASPRDIVYTELAETLGNTEPQIIAKTDLRYGGMLWGDESLALVYESWHKTRRTRTWIIAPEDSNVEPRILFDRSTEDVYSDPGNPMLRRTVLGTYVLAQLKNSDGKSCLLLNGSGASPDGYVPFIDLFDTETGKKERIWESDKEKYFENVAALMSDKVDTDLSVGNLKLLISKESQIDPPQYYLRTWPEQRVTQVTNFPHPYPQLRNLKKEIIKYKRNDGVQLMATLYLPPSYDPSRDGPLPMLMWAYPREFKNKDNAGQMRGSPNTFAGIGSTSALLWLSRGFAILDGPTMPIIGEGDEEANDRYVEQLIASAQAAVDEVIRRGVADPKKIAVGGHSYGAFMTANLLIHAPHLFCCGISRSGAYNRTLTPFGFQSEERTIWEAQKTYIEMSPFMLANKLKKPILLIHGEEDNNAGTVTMQSERFYAALKGNGTLCRLVLLPLESHGYSGRESVMHCLWEMDRWLQKYCVNASEE
ncbi:probable glutamyl endopeptidase, chloroplastic [Physcomitrium patens]|uniref:Probable glutamyl endopeptidase, chloroplastic n=1 Tax=Physcomitrium patens TaxID=3218 RepID=A0A2K1IE71_PHYPA|nr:probable glutamyl endopeptidase, chloroplastic [Physcomitrium patens]PNR27576.1 hypothetical protein PHYPA_029728 [Physcomitrium patens]|eukprot:XP_024364873.1 probable glutamyl endopeptidase, chloroplastic [Physcomitrella patens]